jgi:sorbitol-specific phosphotransferase system component IIA
MERRQGGQVVVTTSTTHGTGQPINVILPDHTIVLMWIVKTEAIRQFSLSDMNHAEVELADFEAVILAKQAKHIPTFAGATFELNGNAYVIDAVSQSAADVIKRQSIHLKNIWVSARSFFPA